jgi:hypothetical protein
MNISDFTILFQGKVFPETQQYINYYKDKGFNVLLSTYENVKTKADQLIVNDITLAEKLSENKTGATKSGKYQIFSTYSGLKFITTKYAIKIRTDECYNLNKIINLFLNNDNKIIFHNLFFRPSNYKWGFYHISDKLLIGKTNNLMDMFYSAYSIVNETKKIIYSPRSIEDLLGYSYILIKNNFCEDICITNTFNNIDKWMLEYYDFINFTDLAPFKIKFNSMNNDIYTECTIDTDYHEPWVEVTKKFADIIWKQK